MPGSMEYEEFAVRFQARKHSTVAVFTHDL